MAQLIGQPEGGNKEPFPNAGARVYLLPRTAYQRSGYNRPVAVLINIFFVLLSVFHGQSEGKEMTSAVGPRRR
jgi:hypothetical protein